MMLSFGSCLMISLTTVSPPMPESNTPIGADRVTSPGKSRPHSQPPLGGADLNVRIEVGEICGDVSVSAGKEVVEHDHRDPILEMRASCPHAIGEVLVSWSEVYDRLTGG